MNNQDDVSGKTLDMHQLKWALRHGQIVDGLENMVLISPPAELADNHMENNSIVDNSSLHNTVLKEEIDNLGQSFNREILSLKSEFAIITQNTALEEQIEQLGQTLSQEILSLKDELAIVAQGMAVEEQIDQLGKSMNQEILSLRNEFAMFVQTQLNQEKAWKIAEIDWKNSLKDRELQLQADMLEMQHNMMRKFEENFQYLDTQLQDNDNMLRQEVALLTSQFVALQKYENSKEEIQVTQWQKKVEERQMRLVEDMGYIQYILEEIATRPQSYESQEKLREKFFIREISALREEIAVVCQKWKAMDNGCGMTEAEQYNKSLAQQAINLGSEEQTQVYKKKRKRRL